MKAREILEVCLYASDLEATEKFYRDVMGLDLISHVEGRHVFFRCGSRVLLIFNADETQIGKGIPAHGTQGHGHICFAIRADELASWQTHLEANDVEIEHHETWGDRGESIYFRDPDGNSLELATPRIWGISEDTLD